MRASDATLRRWSAARHCNALHFLYIDLECGWWLCDLRHSVYSVVFVCPLFHGRLLLSTVAQLIGFLTLHNRITIRCKCDAILVKLHLAYIICCYRLFIRRLFVRSLRYVFIYCSQNIKQKPTHFRDTQTTVVGVHYARVWDHWKPRLIDIVSKHSFRPAT